MLGGKEFHDIGNSHLIDRANLNLAKVKIWWSGVEFSKPDFAKEAKTES